MRELLRIGEAAALLGATPKTLRHYERLGLLATPRRSESGYRLYTAADLLRLREVRRLQALGLRLRDIRRVLGAPETAAPLATVLRSLLAEVVVEIAGLEERRARIERLLGEDEKGEHRPSDDPPMLRMIAEVFGDRLDAVSPEVREQARRMAEQLDGFHWPGGWSAELERGLRHVAARPELFARLLAIDERIAALAHVPEDSPEVEELTREMRRVWTEAGLEHEATNPSTEMDGPVGAAMAAVLGEGMSPAQRRFLRLLEAERECGEG